ncbi:hypothetical protein ACFPRL_03730 [Pseudoclavibacter helvolus]
MRGRHSVDGEGRYPGTGYKKRGTFSPRVCLTGTRRGWQLQGFRVLGAS